MATLYAIWQGLRHFPEASRPAAKQLLDETMATMQPGDWNNLEVVVASHGEQVFKGLVQYGLDWAIVGAAPAPDVVRVAAAPVIDDEECEEERGYF